MPKIIYKDVVLAESDDVEVVEGNYYFPPQAVKTEYFKPNDQSTFCPWKGTASYYDIEVNGDTLSGAAWYYPEPKPAAEQIKDRVAFYKGKVTIED